MGNSEHDLPHHTGKETFKNYKLKIYNSHT